MYLTLEVNPAAAVLYVPVCLAKSSTARDSWYTYALKAPMFRYKQNLIKINGRNQGTTDF